LAQHVAIPKVISVRAQCSTQLTGLWKNPYELSSVPKEQIIGSGISLPVRTAANAKSFIIFQTLLIDFTQ